MIKTKYIKTPHRIMVTKYDYVVTWAEKPGYGGYEHYWFLPAHDEYCIELAEPIEITESFGKRINNANMGNIIGGYTINGKKIVVKIGARRY